MGRGLPTPSFPSGRGGAPSRGPAAARRRAQRPGAPRGGGDRGSCSPPAALRSPGEVLGWEHLGAAVGWGSPDGGGRAGHQRGLRVGGQLGCPARHGTCQLVGDARSLTPLPPRHNPAASQLLRFRQSLVG